MRMSDSVGALFHSVSFWCSIHQTPSSRTLLRLIDVSGKPLNAYLTVIDHSKVSACCGPSKALIYQSKGLCLLYNKENIWVNARLVGTTVTVELLEEYNSQVRVTPTEIRQFT